MKNRVMMIALLIGGAVGCSQSLFGAAEGGRVINNQKPEKPMDRIFNKMFVNNRDAANIVKGFSSDWQVAFPAGAASTAFAQVRGRGEFGAIAVNAQYLAVGTKYGKLLLYDMINKKRTELNMNGDIRKIVFSPKGDKIAVQQGVIFVTVIDLDAPAKRVQKARPIMGKRGGLINFSRNGNYIICAEAHHRDNGISHYLVLDTSLERVQELKQGSYEKNIYAHFPSMIASDDGKFAFSGRVDSTLNAEVNGTRRQGELLSVSPSGRFWVAHDGRTGNWSLYDSVEGTSVYMDDLAQRTNLFATKKKPSNCAFALDESKVVCFLDNPTSKENPLFAWDLRANKEILTTPLIVQSNNSFDISPDGQYLISCEPNADGDGFTIKFYDFALMDEAQEKRLAE